MNKAKELTKPITDYLAYGYDIEGIINDIKYRKPTKNQLLNAIVLCMDRAIEQPVRFNALLKAIGITKKQIEPLFVAKLKRIDAHYLYVLVEELVSAKTQSFTDLANKRARAPWLILFLKHDFDRVRTAINQTMIDTNKYHDTLTTREKVLAYLNKYLGPAIVKKLNLSPDKYALQYALVNILKYGREASYAYNYAQNLKESGFTMEELLQEVVDNKHYEIVREAVVFHFSRWQVAGAIALCNPALFQNAAIAIVKQNDPALLKTFPEYFFGAIKEDIKTVSNFLDYSLPYLKTLFVTPTIVQSFTTYVNKESMKNDTWKMVDFDLFMTNFSKLSKTPVFAAVKAAREFLENKMDAYRVKMQPHIKNYVGNKKGIYVYHRTKSKLIARKIKQAGFKAGAGALYGVGIYFTRDIQDQLNDKMLKTYGPVIVRVLANLDNYLIFDRDLGRKIYGSQYKVEDHIKELFNVDFDFKEDSKYTSEDALLFIRTLANNKAIEPQYLVNGLVFTGRHDGKVVVAYNYKGMVPVDQKVARGSNIKDAEWLKNNMELIEHARTK